MTKSFVKNVHTKNGWIHKVGVAQLWWMQNDLFEAKDRFINTWRQKCTILSSPKHGAHLNSNRWETGMEKWVSLRILSLLIFKHSLKFIDAKMPFPWISIPQIQSVKYVPQGRVCRFKGTRMNLILGDFMDTSLSLSSQQYGSVLFFFNHYFYYPIIFRVLHLTK